MSNPPTDHRPCTTGPICDIYLNPWSVQRARCLVQEQRSSPVNRQMEGVIGCCARDGVEVEYRQAEQDHFADNGMCEVPLTGRHRQAVLDLAIEQLHRPPAGPGTAPARPSRSPHETRSSLITVQIRRAGGSWRRQFARLVTNAASSVADGRQQRETANGHQAVDHHWADMGAERRIAPERQYGGDMRVRNQRRTEGNSARTAKSRQVPQRAVRPPDSAQCLHRQQQRYRPHSRADLGVHARVPAGGGVCRSDPGRQHVRRGQTRYVREARGLPTRLRLFGQARCIDP
jgi:hypothetical protein